MPTPRALTLVLAVLLAATLLDHAVAADGKIDLDVQNPAIQKLRARMADRAKKLDTWKDKGAIGEEAAGILNDRQLGSLGLADKKEVHDLAVAENEDRYALFRELVIANGLQDKDLAAIGGAFAKSRRQTAAAEHLVQHPATKAWVKKKDLQD